MVFSQERARHNLMEGAMFRREPKREGAISTLQRLMQSKRTKSGRERSDTVSP